MSKTTKRLTSRSAARAALASLDAIMLKVATGVAGNKAKGAKLMRSVKRGAKRGDVLQAAFFAIAAPVWEARETLHAAR